MRQLHKLGGVLSGQQELSAGAVPFNVGVYFDSVGKEKEIARHYGNVSGENAAGVYEDERQNSAGIN